MAAVASNEANGTYTFSSQPHALSARQRKYKQIFDEAEEDEPTFGNIMYDRRVIRGNTYAIQRSLYQLQAEVAKKLEENEKRRMLLREKLEKRKHKKDQIAEEDLIDENEQEEVVEDPQYEVVPADPNDLYYDKGWYDPNVPRPVSPPYVAATTLSDVSTQIEPGDLFDFEDEVRPVLEVFVGVTVEQALLEVDEEEDLFKMREQRRLFQELRNTELAEKQRLEDQHRRLTEEKERRKKQHEKAMKQQAEIQTKIAALIFSQNYIDSLVPTIFGTLSQNGYFYDPVERQAPDVLREVEDLYMPFLVDQAISEIGKQVQARLLLDSLIREAAQIHQAESGNMSDLRSAEALRRVQREAEAAERAAAEKQSDSVRPFRAARKSPKQRDGAPQHETIPEEPSDLTDAEEPEDLITDDSNKLMQIPEEASGQAQDEQPEAQESDRVPAQPEAEAEAEAGADAEGDSGAQEPQSQAEKPDESDQAQAQEQEQEQEQVQEDEQSLQRDSSNAETS